MHFKRVTPNPASSQLILVRESSKPGSENSVSQQGEHPLVQVQLHNNQGKLVKQGSGKADALTSDVQDLPSGICYLRSSNEKDGINQHM